MSAGRGSPWLAALLVFAGAGPAHAQVARDTLRFGPFGRVVVYHPGGRPTGVVLFVSGDGGWNLGVVGMATELARRGALVAGIDITAYLRALDAAPGECTYPAGDLENLAQVLERRARMPRYLAPVLVGYSSGATLAYAALAEAPDGTFAGAVSLGFCPDLPIGKPFCRGARLGAAALRTRTDRGYRFDPATGAPLPWIVLQGTVDQVCGADSARAFVARVPGARIVTLPRVGHGFGVPARWLPQLTAAVDELIGRGAASPPLAPAAVADLPLIEVPAAAPADDRLAIVVSGDGGWASLDREVGDALAAGGTAVVGWSSLHYFWTARTPDGAAADLGRVARHYLSAWAKRRLVLIGYSRGADVLPFMAARLPEDVRRAVVEVVLIGPSSTANFTFHAADLLLEMHHGGDLPLRPALEQLRGLRVLCLSGADETDSACRDVAGTGVRSVELSGGHHFGGRYGELARIIKQEW